MNAFRRVKTSLSDPDFVPVVYHFETVEELLALEEVQWAKSSQPGAQFVLSGKYLMVLYKDGFEWWVVGLIEKPELVDLPQWEGAKVRVQLPDGTEIVTTEIRSLCGDQITMKDGTVATRVRQ